MILYAKVASFAIAIPVLTLVNWTGNETVSRSRKTGPRLADDRRGQEAHPPGKYPSPVAHRHLVARTILSGNAGENSA